MTHRHQCFDWYNGTQIIAYKATVCDTHINLQNVYYPNLIASRKVAARAYCFIILLLQLVRFPKSTIYIIIFQWNKEAYFIFWRRRPYWSLVLQVFLQKVTMATHLKIFLFDFFFRVNYVLCFEPAANFSVTFYLLKECPPT